MKKNILEVGILANKKGSGIVLILLLLSAILILIYAYILATKKIATISYTDSISTLAGKSLLSEYDLNLKEDYGILAFHGLEYNIESKMANYINYSFRKKGNLTLEMIKVDRSNDALISTKRAKEEMVSYGKYLGIKKFLKDTPGEIIENDSANRVLRNKGAINSLPSKDIKSKSIISKIISFSKNSDNIFKEVGDEYFLNQYILTMFNSKAYKSGRRTFFENEVEYILQGNFNDDSNYNSFRKELLLLRNGINFAHIYTDPNKLLQLEAAALAISPGPQAAVTQLALAESWALAEAENDVRLLEHGKKVPVLKTQITWAIDLDSIVSGSSKGYIDTNSSTGLTYQGYLQLFLFFLHDEIKISRVLDLIQINIQSKYNRTFLVKEYNLGYDVRLKVNGKNYGYNFKY